MMHWRSLAAALAVMLISQVNALAAAGPENLSCQGNPAPPLPGPGWMARPVWEWRNLVSVEGTLGSNDGPYAVALDRQCNSYVTDSEHFRVLKLSPDGSVTAKWDMPGQRNPGESSSPRGVAVDQAGNVYVTDTPRDRVYKLSPRGEVVAIFGECQGGGSNCDPKLPGRFISPEGIAVDGGGNIYVAETAGGRVQKLSADGKSLGVWDLKSKGLGELFIPGSLSTDQGGFVYMTEAYNNLLVKFDPQSGNVVGKWGGADVPFHGPSGVGVDAGGAVYVSDAQNWRVVKLGPDGSFQDQWRNCLDGDPPCQFPDAGAEPGQFMASRGITVDGQGTVYVADTANKRVQRLMIVDWVLIPPPPPPDEEG